MCWGNADQASCEGVAAIVEQWFHVAMTVDASRARLYLDGELALEEPAGALGDYDDGLLLVGADVDNATLDLFFVGDLDEVQVHERALTADEVAVLTQP